MRDLGKVTRRRVCRGELLRGMRTIWTTWTLTSGSYWALKNSWSMDGLPALQIAQKAMVQQGIEPLKKMVGPLAPRKYRNGNRFSLTHLLLVALVTAIVTAFVTRFGLDTAHAIAVRLPADASQFAHAPLRTQA